MRLLLLSAALLVSTQAIAGDSKNQWKTTSPRGQTLEEPVTTMAISGINIRLGTTLERLTLLSGEGHGGKKAGSAAMAVGLSLLGVGGVDTASREPLEDHFGADDARKIGEEIAISIQEHLQVPGVTLVAAEQIASVPALHGSKISYELLDDNMSEKGGMFSPDLYYGYYMVPAGPYGYRTRSKFSFSVGDGDVAPAVRAAVGAQAAISVDIFLVNTRKAFQVKELKVEVLAPQKAFSGRDVPLMSFELPAGALSVPVTDDTHKDNYAAWLQMKPLLEAKLDELGPQIEAGLAKSR